MDRKIIFAVILSLLPATQALAGEWSGQADLGYSAASGNSETQHLNAGFGVKYETGLWTHGLQLGLLREEEGGMTNADRYESEFKSQYSLTERGYAFGVLIHERDEFGGLRKRNSATVGYGHQFIDTDQHQLEAEIGLGGRWSERQDATEDNSGIVRMAGKYHRHLSETASFDQSLLIERGDDNTYIESETALKLAVIKSIFAKLGYVVKHNAEVPVGLEDTDTYTTVSLSYEF